MLLLDLLYNMTRTEISVQYLNMAYIALMSKRAYGASDIFDTIFLQHANDSSSLICSVRLRARTGQGQSPTWGSNATNPAHAITLKCGTVVVHDHATS